MAFEPDDTRLSRSSGTKMDRRQFLRGTAAVAVSAAQVGSAAGAADALPGKSDRLVISGLDTSRMTEAFIGLLRQGGVHCSHVSLYGAYSYGGLLRFVDQHAKDVTVARTAQQILGARRDGRIALVCGSQAASDYIPQLMTQGPGQTYGVIAEALRTQYELGMRTQGISYNTANIFGGGCLEPRSPLTRVGRRLVEEIHKLRILLDVGGHTGEQTSLDALEMSTGVPVVCTHTNVAALNPNPRATSDRVLEKIAQSGGVVGVTAISDFHTRNSDSIKRDGPRSPQATLDQHLDQYDYLKRLIGVDHLALGPDFIFGSMAESYVNVAPDSVNFPSDSMGDGQAPLVKDFENISKLPNLVRGLQGRGWSEPELDKLMGANWLRVYGRVWGG